MFSNYAIYCIPHSCLRSCRSETRNFVKFEFSSDEIHRSKNIQKRVLAIPWWCSSVDACAECRWAAPRCSSCWLLFFFCNFLIVVDYSKFVNYVKEFRIRFIMLILLHNIFIECFCCCCCPVHSAVKTTQSRCLCPILGTGGTKNVVIVYALAIDRWTFLPRICWLWPRRRTHSNAKHIVDSSL